MPRPRSEQPTDGELEILKVLWERGPAALRDICAEIRQGRQVATTTVATLLKLMEEKGLARREPHSGRGALWAAAITREAATGGLLTRLLDRAFDGSANDLVTRLLEDRQLTADELDQLRRRIDDYRTGREPT